MMQVGDTKIEIIRGDITDLDVDALVCPANTRLTMDEGLAAAMAEKGGAAVREEAMSHVPVDVGSAIVTRAGFMTARHLIHAVIEGVDGWTDQDMLRHAAASALQCARGVKAQSVAFPAMGSAQGLPLEGSAKILTQEILKVCKKQKNALGPGFKKIVFCLLDAPTYQVFDQTIRSYLRHLQEDLGYGPYVTVDMIIECPAGIVLVERSNPPYGWALPGGFVDYGESLEEAARREAKEETNLDLTNLRQFHTFSDPGRDPRFHTVSTVFVAEGQGTPRSGDDAKALKIVRYEDLLELEYAFDHKDILKEYLIERDMD